MEKITFNYIIYWNVIFLCGPSVLQKQLFCEDVAKVCEDEDPELNLKQSRNDLAFGVSRPTSQRLSSPWNTCPGQVAYQFSGVFLQLSGTHQGPSKTITTGPNKDFLPEILCILSQVELMGAFLLLLAWWLQSCLLNPTRSNHSPNGFFKRYNANRE